MEQARARREKFRVQRTILTLGIAAFVACAPRLSHSTDEDQTPEPWTFRVTASVMAADVSGETEFTAGQTVGGNVIRGEIDYSNVYPDPQPLPFVDLAASNAEWSATIRGQYLSWDDVALLANRTLIEESSWFLEADVSHSVGTRWAVFLGLRYFEFELSLQTVLNPPLPPLPAMVTNQSWVDPLAGAAFRYPLGERWELAGRGDIGGFGVGSELSWGLEATVLWKIGTHSGLVGGYRVFDVDFEEENTYSFPDGSQLTVPDSYDTRTNGPTLGMTFQW